MINLSIKLLLKKFLDVLNSLLGYRIALELTATYPIYVQKKQKIKKLKSSQIVEDLFYTVATCKFDKSKWSFIISKTLNDIQVLKDDKLCDQFEATFCKKWVIITINEKYCFYIPYFSV